MSWDESMSAVFDDLEQQATGLHFLERDVEVADLAVAEYSRVGLGARLHASLGAEVRVRLLGGLVLSGRLARVGKDWLMLAEPASEWIVRQDGVASVRGLADRADDEETWSLVDRLSVGTVLRRLSEVGERCLVHLIDGQQMEGRLRRVGRDFVELYVGVGPDASMQVVPVASISALRGRTE